MKYFCALLLALLGLVEQAFAQTGDVWVYEITQFSVGFGASADVAANQYLDLVVPGPLFNADGQPVGGFIDDGRQIQPWVLPSQGGGNFAVGNAVFGQDTSGTFWLVPYDDPGMLPSMRWAIQNGPTLVQNGQNVRGTSTSKFPRAGIGYRGDTLVVIVSLKTATFREFADMFVQRGCEGAIYLDGGPPVGVADNKYTLGTLQPGAKKLQLFHAGDLKKYKQ